MRSRRKSLFYLSGLMIGSIGISSAAFGAIITTTETQVGTGGTSTFTPVYPIATANNVLYQIGSVTPPAGGSVTPGSGNFQQEAAGGVAVLTDASFGPINSGVTGNHLEFATVGNNGGTSLVYKFNAAALSKLEVYGGWNDLGRDDVDVTISYSTNGGSTFNTLTTIAYAPNIAAGIQSASKIVVTDDTGNFGGGASINALQFTFPTVENGYVGLAELAAYSAVPAPEPTTVGVIGMGLAGMAMRRSRRR